MRERGRHPFFEGLVFALALVLAGIVGFYSLRRVLKPGFPAPAAGPAAMPASSAPPDQDPGAPASEPETDAAGPSDTEDSVDSLPPVRVTGQAPEKKPVAGDVPPP